MLKFFQSIPAHKRTLSPAEKTELQDAAWFRTQDWERGLYLASRNVQGRSRDIALDLRYPSEALPLLAPVRPQEAPEAPALLPALARRPLAVGGRSKGLPWLALAH